MPFWQGNLSVRSIHLEVNETIAVKNFVRISQIWELKGKKSRESAEEGKGPKCLTPTGHFETVVS